MSNALIFYGCPSIYRSCVMTMRKAVRTSLWMLLAVKTELSSNAALLRRCDNHRTTVDDFVDSFICCGVL
jgi:hypothetical protein